MEQEMDTTQNTRHKSRMIYKSNGTASRVLCSGISTEEQAENPEGSIKNQEERLKMALALRNGDQPFGKLVAVFCDAGRKSGKDMNRPELKRLLGTIESGEKSIF